LPTEKESRDVQSGLKQEPLAEVNADLAERYLDLLLVGNRVQAVQLILSKVDEGTSIPEIYLDVFQPAQREIGRLWEVNQITVAQEHFCSAATQQIMSMFYPRFLGTGSSGPSLVATCVSGELHEIGIRMVSDFFEMAGWNTYYLGANTPPADIIQTLISRGSKVLAISATITYHIPRVIELIDEVRRSTLGEDLPILVGGRPFLISPGLWERVGADGFAVDARQAVVAAASLLEGEH
jgi:MerR family transcriptional regulator, light-induced transcriptional regulator